VKSKVKSMLIIFFDIKGMLIKNSSWHAKQSIPHTTVTFYGDCVIICEVKKNEIGRECSTNGEKRNGYTLLVGKPER
jgi:hypothetical protein